MGGLLAALDAGQALGCELRSEIKIPLRMEARDYMIPNYLGSVSRVIVTNKSLPNLHRQRFCGVDIRLNIARLEPGLCNPVLQPAGATKRAWWKLAA